MEEQQLERAKERKKKEAEGRKTPGQELSKLEKETFMTPKGTYEHEDNKVFSYQRRVEKWQEEALELKFPSPRFKSVKDKNAEYIKPVTVMLHSTKWDKEGTLDIPRPKAKEVVMKLSDEIGTRKRIEPVKSKVEFSTVKEEKSGREKISIEAAEAMFYPKVVGTTERNVLKVYTKEFINEVKFEKKRLKIPKRVENGKKIIEELKNRTAVSVGTSAEGKAPEEELELFELFIKSSTGIFPKGISIKKPVLLILAKPKDDNYGSSLQIICREIFHELIGGLPIPIIRSKGKKDVEEGKKDVEEELRAENRIEFIDNSMTEYFTPTSSKIKQGKEIWDSVDWEKIGKRLNEFYAQGFGVVIFQIPGELLKEFKEKLEEITGDLRPQIIELYPRYTGNIPILTNSSIIDVIELKKGIASAVWGFIVPKGDQRWKEGETFDNFFTACENEFYERLNKIRRIEVKVGNKKLLPSFLVNIGENESDLHYWMKVFIVKYLIEKERYDKETIKTETPLAPDSKIIPDIQVDNRVIEVETLYGTGVKYHDPLNKVVETIGKYKNGNFNLQIILKNLDLFFYYKDLTKLKKSAKDEWNRDVEFFGLNLDKEELIPLDEFVNLIKILQAQEYTQFQEV
jgi:hypothetical protein